MLVSTATPADWPSELLTSAVAVKSVLTWEDANLGDFQDFVTRWDSAHLAQLQSNWDNDNVEGESESDKLARLGARPTSYSSS